MVGLHQSRIGRFANKEEIRELVEQEGLKLAESIPDAVANMKTLIREMPTLDKKDHKNRTLSYRASERLLESAAILNSQVQSQTFVNITQNNTLVTQEVLQVIGRYLEDPVKDAEYDE